MRRFGKDIEEAAKRIRELMTRQEATKARATRVAAEADRLRASGWRPNIQAVERGPTLDDAQAAIETHYARDAAINAEAARRLAQQEAQRAQAGEVEGALPLPPRMPQRRMAPGASPIDEDIFNRFAFDNSSKWEGLKDQIYYDSRGVPTIGYGYALAVDGSNGWSARSEQDLEDVEIVLAPSDRERLERVAQALKSNRNAVDSDRVAATEQAAPIGDYGTSLSEETARRTFDLTIPEYKAYVMDAIGAHNFNRLHPAQRAALFDFAYRGPAALLNNGEKLRTALESDFDGSDWENTTDLLDRIAKRRNDGILDIRSSTNIDEFKNPMAAFVYRVEPGDTIDSVAAKVGWTTQEFLNRYPQYAGGDILAGERIYFDSPIGRRRSGRIP